MTKTRRRAGAAQAEESFMTGFLRRCCENCAVDCGLRAVEGKGERMRHIHAVLYLPRLLPLTLNSNHQDC